MVDLVVPVIFVENRLSLLNGLVAYWNLDDANSNYGSFNFTNNGVTFSSNTLETINNKASYSNSIGVRLHQPYNSVFAANQNFTIAGWVHNSFTSPTAYRGLFCHDDVFTNRGIITVIDQPDRGGRLAFGIRENNNNQSGSRIAIASIDPLPLGTWVFLVFYHDLNNKTIGLKVNNSSFVTDTYNFNSIYPGNQPITLGAINQNFRPTSNLSRWGFWNRLLNTEEISYLYTKAPKIVNNNFVPQL